MPSRGLYSGSTGRSLFGAQGGDFGTGQNLTDWVMKATRRKLMSPDEFAELDPMVRRTFGNYMGYLNAMTRSRNLKQREAQSYEQAMGGTYQPAEIPAGTFGTGKTVSTRGSGVPKTSVRVHRGMSGIPGLELAGGGIRKTMGGDTITSMPGQEHIIPSMTLDSDTAYLERVARQMEAGTKVASGLTPTAIKARQLAQKDTAEGRMAAAEKGKGERFERALTSREKQAETLREWKDNQRTLQQEYKTAERVAAQVFRSGERKEREEFIKTLAEAKGQLPGTDQARAALAARIEAQRDILNERARLALSEDERRSIMRLDEMMLSQQLTLERMEAGGKVKGEIGGLSKQIVAGERPDMARSFRTFASEAEAEAANLPPGTEVIINGRRAVIE